MAERDKAVGSTPTPFSGADVRDSKANMASEGFRAGFVVGYETALGIVHGYVESDGPFAARSLDDLAGLLRVMRGQQASTGHDCERIVVGEREAGV